MVLHGGRSGGRREHARETSSRGRLQPQGQLQATKAFWMQQQLKEMRREVCRMLTGSTGSTGTCGARGAASGGGGELHRIPRISADFLHFAVADV